MRNGRSSLYTKLYISLGILVATSVTTNIYIAAERSVFFIVLQLPQREYRSVTSNIIILQENREYFNLLSVETAYFLFQIWQSGRLWKTHILLKLTVFYF